MNLRKQETLPEGATHKFDDTFYKIVLTGNNFIPFNVYFYCPYTDKWTFSRCYPPVPLMEKLQ